MIVGRCWKCNKEANLEYILLAAPYPANLGLFPLCAKCRDESTQIKQEDNDMVTSDRPRGNNWYGKGSDSYAGLRSQDSTSTSSSSTRSPEPPSHALRRSEVLLRRMDEILSRLAEAEKQLSKQVDYILSPSPIGGSPEDPSRQGQLTNKVSDRFVDLLEDNLNRLESLTERMWRIVSTLEDF